MKAAQKGEAIEEGMPFPVRVPLVNLKPSVEAAAPGWRDNLQRMFHRMQFIIGEQCSLFEQEFAASQEARFAVGTGSGTSALQLSLRVAGILKTSQEVILPALTSPFTALAVLAPGESRVLRMWTRIRCSSMPTMRNAG